MVILVRSIDQWSLRGHSRLVYVNSNGVSTCFDGCMWLGNDPRSVCGR